MSIRRFGRSGGAIPAIRILAALAVASTVSLSSTQTQAAGCIRGAIVGGLAGHLVHHGMLGAAAGCAIGHHEASKQAPRTPPSQGFAGAPTRPNGTQLDKSDQQ